MTFKPTGVSVAEAHINGQYSYTGLLEDEKSRAHWQTFFESFSRLGNEEMASRSYDITRFLKENGVMYNVHGDPSGLHRAWNLDAVPYLVSKENWNIVESGLKQRAGLFDLILKDIYGEQNLIKLGIIPMEIIYSHHGFLRECCNIPKTAKHYLTIYSADMAQSRDGRIWILNDRTQAPSGFGYALENRMALARIVPELFNGLKVRRLSPFFNALRNALSEMALKNNEQPRIVILTPGPRNETYFEHSFLSSHLGFTLVQGDDLMVKDNFVWLKTLGGLEKVDVIMRRVDDIYCDPLELKQDSQLGIPGLLQAARSGNVHIANPLGSSVIENPGLLPFLPAIARYFLSEELILPSIASWWCGQEKVLQFVLDNLSSLVIKRIYRDFSTRTSVDATTLNAEELNKLKATIKARPHLYVGQEKVDYSLAPAWVKGNFKPCTALFRSFAVSSNDSYIVMNGGLTRTSIDKSNMVISNQLGGYSKDTWVLSDEDAGTFNLKKEQDFVQGNNGNHKDEVLPSRTAENLFWVGRYAERVLGNARFIRTIIQYVEEANNAFMENDPKLRECLLSALTKYTYTYPGFAEPEDPGIIKHPWRELESVLFDADREGSLCYNINCFTRTLYAVTGHWSADTWRVLREMEEAWRNASSSKHTGHYKMLGTVDNVITSMMAFISLNRESISREQGWSLLDAGRKTEQSLLLISMLQATLLDKQEDNTEYILQEVVLNSNECMSNYRYKYRSHLKLSLLLELMLFDPNNPRSLIYQVERLKKYLSDLPKINSGHTLAQHERLSLEVFTKIKLADKDHLAQLDLEKQFYQNLGDFLDEISALLHDTSVAVSATYFKHAQMQQQLFR